MNCKSPGCNNPTRYRPFKGSIKQYSEGTCRACQGTMRRWGMTKPERDEYIRNGGGKEAPLGGSWPSWNEQID